MKTRMSVSFPYMADDADVYAKLCQLLESARPALHDSPRKPVLVVNKDSINRGSYAKFEEYLKRRQRSRLLESVDVIKVWSVDTCQMWLNGFGRIIDDERQGAAGPVVLHVPGDLKYMKDFRSFLDRVAAMSDAVKTGRHDIVVGDFDAERETAKQLIDVYGTYPLLFNWFPQVALKLRETLQIMRPRSEFFAVSLPFLREMLTKRKFAYEQTLAFLIYALSDSKSKWHVGGMHIGTLEDSGQQRDFREAIDQIERTERMLRVLWRELNGRDSFDTREFNVRDRHSTAIREAAMVFLDNVLKARRAESQIDGSASPMRGPVSRRR